MSGSGDDDGKSEKEKKADLVLISDRVDSAFHWSVDEVIRAIQDSRNSFDGAVVILVNRGDFRVRNFNFKMKNSDIIAACKVVEKRALKDLDGD